jgi:hypothetical protein
MRRLLWLIAFAAVGAGLAACALVSSLNDFSAVTLDAGASMTKPVDARADAPAVTEDDTGSDDATDAGPPPGDDGTPPGDDADAESDAPERDDADAEEVADVVDSEPPPVDASDGGAPPDASDGGCTAVVHMNGEGQTYTDCTARGTYNLDQAAKACAAADAGTCATQSIICGINDTETVECATGASCTCWTYETPNIGHARKTQLAGTICQCPLAGDPPWN